MEEKVRRARLSSKDMTQMACKIPGEEDEYSIDIRWQYWTANLWQ